MSKKNYYIIDSSSLIELNRHNPLDVFPSLWKKIESLIDLGLLVSHREVFNEISKQDDQLSEWAKRNRKMFKEITTKQIKIVKEILNKYPSLIKIERQYDADPWIIALAKEMKEDPQMKLHQVKRLIVTEESLKGNKVKIPYVCKDFDIECINRIEMFREEGWKF